MSAARESPFAVVILAARALDGDAVRVGEMARTARDLGAVAIVAAVPRGWHAPAHARVAHVAPGAPPFSGVRLAMAQLSNTPARYALLWPLTAAGLDVEHLRALVNDVRRTRPMLAAFEGDDVEAGPLMIARPGWLDLMTLGEQGMAALAARHGVMRLAMGLSP